MLQTVNHLTARFRAAALAGALIFSAVSPVVARAEIPRKLEPDYMNAVLAYKAKNFDEAIKLLDELAGKAPDVEEFLEMRALALKSAKQDEKAVPAYEALLKHMATAGRPAKDAAPYHFELGVLQQRAKKNDLAKSHFAAALASDFNTDASHFYLGMIAFGAADWKDSAEHFEKVTGGGMRDLKPASHFYLGQTYLKVGYTSGAVSNLASAKDYAKSMIDAPNASDSSRKMGQQILTASEQVLGPMDRARFFANVSLGTGYDSNALSLPSSIDASQATGKTTAKETVNLGLGYMTSPLGFLQFVPGYRMSFNYNFNRAARSAEFLGHNLDLYVTRSPLEPLNYGLKLTGTYMFQDMVDSSTGNGKFKPFSLGASVGPYLKTELSRSLTLGAEAFIEPTKFYLDSGQPDASKRSGTGLNARVFVQQETGSRWWSPTAAIKAAIVETAGSESDSRGATLSLSDALSFTDQDRGNVALDTVYTSYPKRPAGSRADYTLTFSAGASHRFRVVRGLAASLDGSLTYNGSNLPQLYKYTRFTTTLGISYSL